MKHILLTLLLACAAGTTLAHEPDDLPDYIVKLTGSWQAKAWDGMLYERWYQAADGHMQSQVAYVEKGDTLYEGTTRIAHVNHDLVLISIIKNSAPKIFTATEWTEEKIIFENADYTNPNKVEYDFSAAEGFKRSIFGTEKGEPSNYTFTFTPQPMSALPYHEIPPYPETYNACTVAARMVDGLGFRYYWATEGLRSEDLAYKPSPEGRTADETLDHIYGLTEVVLNSVKQQPNIRPADRPEMSFSEKRRKTLEMLAEASRILKESEPKEMENFNLIFKTAERESSFPFWHQLNGPLADTLWHTGQIVLMRRASGNPFNGKASLFNGKLRE
jgi:hypothetical protein